MSTLTLPETFVGDTYLDGTFLDSNFGVIRDFLNGVSGGIDSTNIGATMKLRNDQLAQSRTISILSIPFQAGGSPAWNTRIKEKTEILAARVALVRTGSGPAMVRAGLLSQPNNNSSVGITTVTIEFNEATAPYSGMGGWTSPLPGFAGKALAPGTLLVISIARTTDVTQCFVQLKVATSHVVG